MVFFAAFAAFAFFVVVGCGKKGPPLPPLVKIPVAPAEMTADRRAATVDLQFTVPATNTDGTRPANIERVDVYGFTGPPTLTEDEILKLGTKVASIPVKAPRDPNSTVDPDETDDEVDAPEGKGLDQGTRARVSEELSEQALVPVHPVKSAKAKDAHREQPRTDGPLLPAPLLPASRTYVGVGISTRGRKGPMSKRVSVPLVSPPPPPSMPKVVYDETTITVTWAPIVDASTDGAGDDVLPSTPLGVTRPTLAYNVYEGTAKLTKAPLPQPLFADTRLTWGEKRCYVIRTVETLDNATIESAASPEVCKTPADTFPPAVPKALQAVASVGAVTLIWEPNTERDLAGYIVMRAAPDGDLQPMMPSPITATTFKDDLAPGTHHVYAVRAVDKAGNMSAPSNRVEETAR